ncbi:MAG: hypothetical protein M3134_01015 [Actinomycetota bacterium]|nr:hypothetical protein [Actinomycetota bacterium]
MPDTAAASPAVFPAPLRTDGYVAWTWRLYKASFVPLFFVFFAGGVVVWLLQFGVRLLTDAAGAETTVEGFAISLATVVVFSTVVGSLLSGVASFVFLRKLGGTPATSGDAWRRLRPKLGHAVVAALYTAMPLLTLLLFLGPIVPYILLPATLGPPVIVHAIVWEHCDFRAAATRAKNLLTGNWGRVIGVLFLIALGAGLLTYMLDNILGRAILDASTGTTRRIWLGILAATTGAALWLLAAAASTVAYLDLRSRFEDLGAEDLAAEAARTTA